LNQYLCIKKTKKMAKILDKIKSLFPRKIIKRFFWLLVLLWLWLSFFANNTVFAQSTPSNTSSTTQEEQQDKKLIDANETFGMILKLVYALLWPILFIVWIALDNTLVYGSFLHLDASLWSLWNIMKNFANFTLWFLVLFAIIRNIFMWPFSAGGDNWTPVKIIKKTLIAGVLIQMSRFLVAVLIDLSTIMTYSIWWLPMTIIADSPNIEGKWPILGINATLKAPEGSTKKDLYYYSTYGDAKIAQCKTQKLAGLTGTYIVWRSDIQIDNDNFFATWLCVLGWWPYRYRENPSITWHDNNVGGPTWANKIYNESIKFFYGASGDATKFTWLIEDCMVIPTYQSKLSTGCKSWWYGALSGGDPFFATGSHTNIIHTFESLLEKSKWFVWPFIAIYGSILNFTELSADPTWDADLLDDFFQMIIKLFFALILFFPLLALAVVLIARIGLLWVAIAASPVIVLLKVFGDILWGEDKILWEYLNTKSIIQLIFAPVFVVFAISMSLIFLTALSPNWKDKSSNVEKAYLSEFGIDVVDEKTYSIMWLVEITMDSKKVNEGMDTFAWFITNMFAVWVIRFFLFAAIKMTKIWKDIGGTIQDSMQKMAMNLPIIPVAGWIWFSAAKSGLKTLSNIWDKVTNQQIQQLREKYPWLYGNDVNSADRGKEGFAKLDENTKTQIVNDVIAGKTWSELTDPQKTLLKNVWIEESNFTSSINTYITSNTSILNTREFVKMENTKVTTHDARQFNSSTIESVIRNESSWKSWAEWHVGSHVQTLDGIKVLVDQWGLSNPDYKLIDVQTYNRDYLWINDNSTNLDVEPMREKLKKQIIKDITKDQNKNYEQLADAEKVRVDKLFNAQEELIQNQIEYIQEIRSNNSNSNDWSWSGWSGAADNADADLEWDNGSD